MRFKYIVVAEQGQLSAPIGYFYAERDTSSAELGSILIRQGYASMLSLPLDPDKWFVDQSSLEILYHDETIRYGWLNIEIED